MSEEIDWEEILKNEWLEVIWELSTKKQLSSTKNNLLNIIENLSLNESIKL
jgi:hypothetical protein